jgi:hypothetical protein
MFYKSCNISEAHAASAFMAKKLTEWGKKVCDIRRGELRMGL